MPVVRVLFPMCLHALEDNARICGCSVCVHFNDCFMMLMRTLTTSLMLHLPRRAVEENRESTILLGSGGQLVLEANCPVFMGVFVLQTSASFLHPPVIESLVVDANNLAFCSYCETTWRTSWVCNGYRLDGGLTFCCAKGHAAHRTQSVRIPGSCPTPRARDQACIGRGVSYLNSSWQPKCQ